MQSIGTKSYYNWDDSTLKEARKEDMLGTEQD